MTQSPTTGDIYIGAVAFAIQFYCDFSGYSDMARGLASMMGFKLSLNFNLPYSATNPAVFWQKWHITLSSWLRDYCYAPLLKAKWINGNKSQALLLTMAIAGFWHGAEWRFVLWGTLWGVLILIYRLLIAMITRYKRKGRYINNMIGILGTILTVNLWMLIGQFFVTRQVSDGINNIVILFTDWSISAYTITYMMTILYYVWPLILIQIAQQYTKNLYVVLSWPYYLRLSVYTVLLLLLMTSGAEGGAEFIYFQF